MKSNYHYIPPYTDTASVVLDSFFVSYMSAADFVYFIPSIQSAIFHYSPGSFIGRDGICGPLGNH